MKLRRETMAKNYLFIAALCAVKPDDAFQSSIEEDGSTTFVSEVQLEHKTKIETSIRIVPTALVASTVSEAKEMALEIVKRKYPVKDGWLGHSVELVIMEKEKMLSILPMLSKGGTVETDNGAAKQERLM
ncbi:MAG: hypothetical protein DMF68_12280 [Acidobacteria bacterium]|nr:MAG: hypothetical protein DMF68_12280 [Acidobacteriota bacterium]